MALLCLSAAACGGSAIPPSLARAANTGVSGGAPAAGVAASAAGTPAQVGQDGSTPPGGQPATAPDPSSVTGGGVPSAEGLGTAGGSVHEPGTSAADEPAVAASGRGRCAGFRNQTGVTDSTVTIANVADINGPVPGIFESAQQAVKAYVAYFNATSTLCGRKLALQSLDSRTDAGADQTAYEKACHDAFAAVGSMSAFDSGGAATAQQCGL
ncbi:MAG: ABC transporter substrate-binding protein, partial [Marmoricola sp.]